MSRIPRRMRLAKTRPTTLGAGSRKEWVAASWNGEPFECLTGNVDEPLRFAADEVHTHLFTLFFDVVDAT